MLENDYMTKILDLEDAIIILQIIIEQHGMIPLFLCLNAIPICKAVHQNNVI